MKKIVSFNPEKLLEDKVIKDYHVDGNNLVITFKDDCKEYYYKEDGSYIKYDIPDGFEVDDLCDDEYVIIGNGSTYCFLNKYSGSLIDGKYEECHPFINGVAVVKLKGRYGVVNKKGKIIIPLEYDKIFDCSDNRIVAKKDGRYACFDKNGKIVKDFSNKEINEFVNGLFVGNKCVFDVNFNKIFSFDKLFGYDLNNKKFYYKIDDKHYIYDNGNIMKVKPALFNTYNEDDYRNPFLYFFGYNTFYYFFNNKPICKMTIDENNIYLDNSYSIVVMKFTNRVFHNENYHLYDCDCVDKIICPKNNGDPIFTFCNSEYFDRTNSIYYIDALPYDNGFAYVKLGNGDCFTLVDKKGKVVSNTDYIRFIDNIDDLYLFKKNDGGYLVVNYKNEIIGSFKDTENLSINYNKKRYIIKNLEFIIEGDIIDNNIEIVIDNQSVLLSDIKGVRVRNYRQRKDNDDSLNEEERLYFDILDFLTKYDCQKLDDTLRNIITEYNEKSLPLISEDAVNKKNMSLFSSLSNDDIKLLYNNYLNKLKRFLDGLKQYSDTIDLINGCRNDNENNNKDLVKDFHDLRKLYKMQGEPFLSINIRLLNSEFDKLKDEIISDILNGLDNEKNINDINKTFEIKLRIILQSLLMNINEQSKLQSINEKIKFSKELLDDRTNNEINSLLLDVKEIYKIVEYIESVTDDKEILDKIKKFKNIQLDLNRNYSENSEYVSDLLKEIIRIKIKVDFIYSASKYKSRL